VWAACRDITSRSIDPAMALFLRVQFDTIVDSNTLTSAQKSERIFQLLPDLATLCDIIQDQLHRYVRGRMDYHAEEDLVESSVQTLFFIQSSEVDFVRCMSEAILEVGCVTDCTNIEESAPRQIRALAILSIALEDLSITTHPSLCDQRQRHC